MNPTRSIIKDSLYKQHVELQRKQNIEWNPRRKEKMDVPVSLKRKEKTKAQRGASRSI